jgi:hypothetical protein
MTETPIPPVGPLSTVVLTVMARSITTPTLLQPLPSSLALAWCVPSLHTQHLLSRFIAVPSHPGSDPPLSVPNGRRLIDLATLAQHRQRRTHTHLLSDYTHHFRQALENLSSYHGRAAKSQAVCFREGMIVFTLIEACKPRDLPLDERDGNKEKPMQLLYTG